MVARTRRPATSGRRRRAEDDSCTYAETYFDRDGNCLNDADGDLVCDELEVDGCTDETACNYSEAATRRRHVSTQRSTSTAMGLHLRHR